MNTEQRVLSENSQKIETLRKQVPSSEARSVTEKLQGLGDTGGKRELEPGHFMVDQFCGLQEGHRLAGSDTIKPCPKKKHRQQGRNLDLQRIHC